MMKTLLSVLVLALAVFTTPARADYVLTVSVQTAHGEDMTLVVTSKDPNFCANWRSDTTPRRGNGFDLTAKMLRQRFASGPTAFAREWGIGETCSGHP
jgi:hypothetical protein